MHYFNQTLNWANFFIQANNSNHKVWIFGQNSSFVKSFICSSQGLLEFQTFFELENKNQQTGNLKNSNKIKKEYQNEHNEEDLVIIYEYPWQFGQKMWYCPRLWLNLKETEQSNTQKIEKIANQEIENLDKIYSESWVKIEIKLLQIITKIKTKAKKNKITFLKFELDLENLDLENELEKLENWQNLSQKIAKNENLQIINSDKKLQYLSTIILDLRDLKIEQNETEKTENWHDFISNSSSSLDLSLANCEPKSRDLQTKTEIKTKLKITNQITNQEIQNFWEQNEKIWTKLLDKRTRYGTRKSLNFWQIDCDKTKENFEIFYNLCSETALRQNFAIHPKRYLKTLFDQEFVRIILLKNSENQVCSCWLGIILGHGLVNLYGGNNEISRSNYGQYFLHLTAILIAKKENCRFYDLGGIEEEKGFNLFKKGYLGQQKNFAGAFDLIFKPFNYQITNSIISIIKTCKKNWKKN